MGSSERSLLEDWLSERLGLRCRVGLDFLFISCTWPAVHWPMLSLRHEGCCVKPCDIGLVELVQAVVD